MIDSLKSRKDPLLHVSAFSCLSCLRVHLYWHERAFEAHPKVCTYEGEYDPVQAGHWPRKYDDHVVHVLRNINIANRSLDQRFASFEARLRRLPKQRIPHLNKLLIH